MKSALFGLVCIYVTGQYGLCSGRCYDALVLGNAGPLSVVGAAAFWATALSFGFLVVPLMICHQARAAIRKRAVKTSLTVRDGAPPSAQPPRAGSLA